MWADPSQRTEVPPCFGNPAAAEFVCANLEQIQQLQVDRVALTQDHLALLQSAPAAAEANGNTDAVTRIDTRIGRVTERHAKAGARQEKLAAFAAANCAE